MFVEHVGMNHNRIRLVRPIAQTLVPVHFREEYEKAPRHDCFTTTIAPNRGSGTDIQHQNDQTMFNIIPRPLHSRGQQEG